MSFLDKVRAGLERTKKSFVKNMETLIIGYDEIDEEFLDDLEAVMLTGDLGVTATDYLLGEIRTAVKEGEIHSTKEVMPFLAKTMETWLAVDSDPAALPHSPEVILIVGVNGVGKTTSIGKLAQYYKNAGKKVLLAAGDTFRAAASEQLTIWAERVGVPIVKHQEGADPAAVVYDALEAALARKSDVVLIDTAGRLHTKVNLMGELAKISRVAAKLVPDAPHQTWLVLDATTGQNAVSQAKVFGQSVPLTGVVLTKLDGTAKGGVVISVKEELGVPVKWVGLGEGVDDLQPFRAQEFVEALFDDEDKTATETTKVRLR